MTVVPENENPLNDPLRPMQFTPAVVHAIYDAWKMRMDARMSIYKRFNALWRTDYWSDRGMPSDRYTDMTTGKDQQIRVEVNRIHGFLGSYLGSLFPSKMTVHYHAQDDRGDDKKADQVGNRWLHRRDMEILVTDWMRQALMYDGSCLKIRVDRTSPKLRNRVVADVVPWWESIIDRDVRDAAKQRFIGHAYYIPRAEAVRRFKDPDIVGTDWTDPLASSDSTGLGLNVKDDRDPARQNFVLVVEWYNYSDDYVVGETDPMTHRPLLNPTPMRDPATGQIIRVRGRYEVYLPGEPMGWETPREVRPLPSVDCDGEVQWAMYPLVYNAEVGFPLRGLSTVERVYDQFREIILSRSMKANSVKRDARQILLPKGWLDTQAKDLFSRGVDGAILEYEQPEGDARNIMQMMGKLDLGNLPSDHSSYDATIENDLVQGGRDPITRGQTSPYISATQTNLANTYASTDIGMMAKHRDAILERVMRHVLVAHVDAMREENADSTLIVKIRGERVEVTANDLDGDFDVDIETGPASGAEEDARRQRLLAVMPALAQILAGVNKGDPAAVILLDEMVELYDLPEQLRSKSLLEMLARAQATTEVKPTPGAAMPGSGQVPTPDAVRDAPRPMPESVMSGAAQNDGRGKPLNPGAPPEM